MSSTRKHLIYRYAQIEHANTDEFIGLCKGVLADGKLVEEEVVTLHHWLNTQRGIVFEENPLLSKVRRFIDEVMEDGVVDAAEIKQVKELLESYTPSGEQGELPKSTALPLTPNITHVPIQGMSFCLTGTFVLGTRKECEDLIAEAGGMIRKSVVKTLDYLVIGEYATESWKHSNAGLKISKAIQYNEQKGTAIKIVAEKQVFQTTGGEVE